MVQVVKTRAAKWLWFALALISGTGAAYAFLFAMAQHESSVALLFGIALQLGAAVALFGVLGRGDDHAAPVVWAVFGSLVLTFVCGKVLLLALRHWASI